MFVVGLDVSTSCTGICLYDLQNQKYDQLTYADYRKCENLYEKVDVTVETLKKLTEGKIVEFVFIEEPLMGFTKGMSSAATITTLMKFNGMISYASRNLFQKIPHHISAAHARKLCGIKLQRVKDCKISHKDQVFQHMRSHDLSNVSWPTKARSSNIVDWAKDATDAYVIAKAGVLINKL